MKDDKVLKQRKLLSVSGKIFMVILLFVVIVLGLTWALEFLLLDTFYASTEKKSIRRNVELIAQNIDNKTYLPTLANRIAHLENMCIVVADNIGSAPIVEEYPWTDSEMGTRTSGQYFELARANENREFFEVTPGKFVDASYAADDYLGNVPNQNLTPSSSYTFAKIIKDSAGETYIIIAEGSINPLSVVKRTLVLQLATVSAVFVILSLFVTAMLAKTIASPIIALNELAKDMPKGDVEFDSVKSGYLEIEELKDTISYASIELDKLEVYRRELVANVSHDLRTPLALIKGYSEMMKDIPSEANVENLQVVIDESSRLVSLVNDMLDLSKLQSGGEKLKFNAFDIVETLGDMLERHGKLLKAQGYTLIWEHEDIGYVYADKSKIIQVMYNLINNAVNYCGEDRQVIVKQYTNRLNIRIEVTDNGDGIDVDVLPHIWDRYYKSEKSHKRAVVGTGLGLSIVKSVMNMHPGGVYGITAPKEGPGSTFYIELPKLDPTMDLEKNFPERIEE